MRNEESRQILGSDLRINTDSTENPVDGRRVEYRGSLRERETILWRQRRRKKHCPAYREHQRDVIQSATVLSCPFSLPQNSNLAAASKLVGHRREGVSMRRALWLQRGGSVMLEAALHPVTAPP